MQLKQAESIAAELVEQMAPYTIRCELAGSIRRQVRAVKDIEIVAVPRWAEEPDPFDLLGERVINTNLLHRWAMEQGRVEWIKPGVSEVMPWLPKPDGKYWRGLIDGPEPVKLDLFLASEINFGVIYLIRTGSADFSHEVAAHAQRMHRPFKDGRLTIAGQPVETPEEERVFELLRLRNVPPAQRTGASAVRVLPVPATKAAP